MVKMILLALLAVNIGGFASMAYDKFCAQRDMWRVRERTLFLWALCGGAIGSYLGMKICRHKTKHWYFVWGIPLCGVLDLCLVGGLAWMLYR